MGAIGLSLEKLSRSTRAILAACECSASLRGSRAASGHASPDTKTMGISGCDRAHAMREVNTVHDRHADVAHDSRHSLAVGEDCKGLTSGGSLQHVKAAQAEACPRASCEPAVHHRR